MTLSDIQYAEGSGKMRLLPKNYSISLEPVSDKLKWGVFAHIGDDIRRRIFFAGEGEVQRHAKWIESHLRQMQKEQKKAARHSGGVRP